jgi:hypothetical protein
MVDLRLNDKRRNSRRKVCSGVDPSGVWGGQHRYRRWLTVSNPTSASGLQPMDKERSIAPPTVQSG